MTADASSSTGVPPAGDSAEQPPKYNPRFIDIGINLADPIFRGVYHGKERHEDDLHAVVDRASEVGCAKLIVTGSSMRSSEEGLELCRQFPGTVYSTAGIHPCSSAIFASTHPQHDTGHTPACGPDPSQPIHEDEHEPDEERSKKIINELRSFIEKARSEPEHGLVAFGEFGLDYDRLHYCSKTIQLHSFAAQLELAASLKPQLPLFLHSRACHQDFVRLLKNAFGERLGKLQRGGVVHSFTGTVEEMKELVDLGLYIGINGCSFKTAENCALVKELDLAHLMLETDGPWCEVRPSHEGYKYIPKPESAVAQPPPPTASEGKPSKKQKNQKKALNDQGRWKVVKKEKWQTGAMVKGRNEPCTIEKIGTIVAGLKGVSVEEVCEAAWKNTVAVFPVEVQDSK
ncbi:hypothetical protein MKZ38_009981 [Zalerion maritima]|uniref:Uncharacterized protein n=1 Tax=Zalerion maritima TaxID=339359 RepID=A0AAD5WUF6_9PEZI|nr:hypothetical protein MKZ38_009981 [Zalerion maritima]